ncbi:MAG: caspase family protein [Chitinophagaceae bacterium]|nr:caspase family protein [Chitinophagaceae bacterium]
MIYRALQTFLCLLVVSGAFSQNRPTMVMESGEPIYAGQNVFFSSNNDFMAISGDKEIRLYDLRSMLFLKSIRGEDNYSYVQFNKQLTAFSFARLQRADEPDDRLASKMVRTVINDSLIHKQHHITNSYSHELIPLANYFLKQDYDTLRFIPLNGKGDTIVKYSSDWFLSPDQNWMMIGKNSYQKFELVSLDNLKTVKTIDFQKPDGDNTWYYRSSVFFADSNYLIFAGESSEDKQVVRIYDRSRDSVICSISNPRVPATTQIFYNSIKFSSRSGILLVPASTGLNVYNIFNQSRQFIKAVKDKYDLSFGLTANGRTIYIKHNDSLSLYNGETGSKDTVLKLKGYSLLVNQQFPLLYINTYRGYQKVCYEFDIDRRRFIDTIEGEAFAIAPNGRILYGEINNTNALLNHLLQPIHTINTCSAVMREVYSGNAAGKFLFHYDGDCEWSKNDKNWYFDFQPWDLNRLAPLPYRAGNEYQFRFKDIDDQYFDSDNFYFRSGSFLYTFSDSTLPKELELKYGYLEDMDGPFLVYKTNDFHLDDTIGNKITVVQLPDKIMGSFNLKNLEPVKTFIDTLTKQVFCISSLAGNNFSYTITSFTYQGTKNYSKRINGPSTLRMDDASGFHISPDNNYLLVSTHAGYDEKKNGYYLFGLKSGQLLRYFPNSAGEDLYVNFGEGKFAYRDSNYFLQTGSYINGKNTRYKSYPVAINDKFLLSYTADGNYQNYSPAATMFLPKGPNKLSLVSWNTTDTIYQETLFTDFIRTGALSLDNKWMAYANFQHQIILVNIPTKTRYILEGHKDHISSLNFADRDSKLVSTSFDGTTKFWSLQDLKWLVSVTTFNKDNYVVIDHQGYYSASKGSLQKFGFTDGRNVAAARQLDLIYNRPDLVSTTYGITDTLLIQSYHRAWQKRIRQSKIDTSILQSAYTVPQLTILDIEKIEPETTKEVLTLKIASTGKNIPLSSFNVWVNECPLFGSAGIGIKAGRTDFDTVLSIHLGEGQNRIETAVTNTQGIESYRLPVSVKYAGASKPSKLYFIGIGIDHFANERYDLRFSCKDIRDLVNGFKAKYGEALVVDTLFNEAVTIENIKKLKQPLEQTNIDDKVVISYSGHGLLSDSLDYFLSTYSVDFMKPAEKGLPYEMLESLVDGIPSRKKLLLIDACHSGEVDKEEGKKRNKKATGLGLSSGRGANPVSTETGPRLGLNNSFELMRELFANMGNNTGATIISAAGGDQYALEGVNGLPNGVFTYSILEAMKKKKTISIKELMKTVSNNVMQLTKGLQQPTSRTDLLNDWELW